MYELHQALSSSWDAGMNKASTLSTRLARASLELGATSAARGRAASEHVHLVPEVMGLTVRQTRYAGPGRRPLFLLIHY